MLWPNANQSPYHNPNGSICLSCVNYFHFSFIPITHHYGEFKCKKYLLLRSEAEIVFNQKRLTEWNKWRRFIWIEEMKCWKVNGYLVFNILLLSKFKINGVFFCMFLSPIYRYRSSEYRNYGNILQETALRPFLQEYKIVVFFFGKLICNSLKSPENWWHQWFRMNSLHIFLNGSLVIVLMINSYLYLVLKRKRIS